MSYIIKTCVTCGKKYHVHSNGKIKGACEHIKIGRIKGRKTYVETADTAELDAMMSNETKKSKTI